MFPVTTMLGSTTQGVEPALYPPSVPGVGPCIGLTFQAIGAVPHITVQASPVMNAASTIAMTIGPPASTLPHGGPVSFSGGSPKVFYAGMPGVRAAQPALGDAGKAPSVVTPGGAHVFII